ncbi:hypothetical protein SORBI_3004G138650 [Sorghum bicolor]|uniref:Uncharacterized protein n=1 Tax=Sorghum bicolor TaxID=4558 RepID=A0A1Z5RNE4_SORBI|nr:hypothetical protein SORBI_3004G138650 [Sorghum bicolor]
MDGDGARAAQVLCLILMLPKELLVSEIILRVIENGGNIFEYLKFRKVWNRFQINVILSYILFLCTPFCFIILIRFDRFRRICDEKTKINLLSLRQIRYYCRPNLPVLESNTEQRFL